MSLELYILRHAIAVPRGTEGYKDDDRPLTEEGRDKMRREVRGMKNLGLSFEAILSSSLLRAWQTAEIVQQHLQPGKEIEEENELKPEGSLVNLLEKLAGRKEKVFLIVGHEPTLSTWIKHLLGAKKATIQLKKGALCHLVLDHPSPSASAELVELLQPKALRRMGKRS